MQPNETNFPPLTMLPMLSYAVAGALDAAKEQLTNLLQIEKKPHILDDETVTRVIRVHTEQIQTIADERVLCAHWRKQKLTVAQTHMIDKIELTLAELEKTNQRILFLATHYKDHTIDKILDMPDEELGLEYLMGKLPDSKDAENNHKKGEASTTSFSLPPEVKCYRKKISNNGFSYKFRHAKWGELGRIDVIPHGNQSQISAYAVAGDPRDPNTELRNSLFRVLAMEFNQILTQTTRC